MHHHPITIQLDANVETAARLLQKLDVRHLPVLDGTRLVGMVSDRDLAEVMYRDPLGGDFEQQQVKELMESDVVSVSPESSVREGIARTVAAASRSFFSSSSTSSRLSVRAFTWEEQPL